MDFLSKLKNFLGSKQQQAQGVVNQAPQQIQSFGNNLLRGAQQDIQRAPIVQSFNNFSNFTQTPQFKGTMQSIGNSRPVQAIASRPLFEPLSVLPGAGNANNPYVRQFSPTIGQFAQGNIIKPLQTAFNPKASLPDRGIGALQAAFAPTPFSIGTQIVSGGIKSLRTGMPMDTAIRGALSKPTDIATEGLGVTNPFLALGINVATGNPKGAIKGLKNIKGVSSALKGVNPQAFDLHPQDADELAIIGEKLLRKVPLGKQEYATVERSFARLFPKIDLNKTSNQKVQQIIAATLDRYSKVPKGVSTPFPSMGLMAGQQATGYKNAPGKFSAVFDKKPRFEIDDSKAKLNTLGLYQAARGEITTLDKVIDHPELFKQYPYLKYMEVNISKDNYMSGNQLASFDGNYINLNHSFLSKNNTKDAKQTLLHEIQHAIQSKEGFARGGSPTLLGTPRQGKAEEILKELDKIYTKYPQKFGQSYDDWQVNTPQNIVTRKRYLEDIAKELRDEAADETFTNYKRLGGELESRSVSNRADLTTQQRAITAPYVDQGIPARDVITRFDDGVSSMVDNGQFKPPYKKGDVTELKKYESALLGDKSGRSVSNISKRAELEFYAKQGDPDAKAQFEALEDIENNIIKAQEAKNASPLKSVNQKNIRLKNTPEISTEQQVPLKTNSSSLVQADPTSNPLGQTLSQLPQGGSGGSSSVTIAQKFPKKPQELNVNNLDLTDAQKAEISSRQINELKETLGDKQILDIAKKSGIDTRSNDIDYTTKKIAEQLNLRRNVVTLQKELDDLRANKAPEVDIIEKLKQIDESARISSEQGTDLARQLRARQILANELDTPVQRIFKLLQNAGIDPEVYTKAAAGVDFNDANQVTAFYRKLVPAKFGDWVDLVRYNSMLSSPLTHLVNASSNVLNSGVIAPIEKTLTGTVDFLRSAVTGSKRTAFAGEGAAYSAGYIKSVGDAAHRFADVMRGKSAMKNLDYKNIPIASGGKLGATVSRLSIPTRLLEASDQFFTTLAKGGERAALNLRSGKGIKVNDLEGQVDSNAAYRVFRGELKDPRQGAVLNAIDEFTSKILQLRSSKQKLVSIPAKFTLPFVKTPMNILKQGLEYSPAGFTTVVGAANKNEQIAKAMMGTAGMLGTISLVTSGRTTWAEPTNPEKRAAFRSAGLQPYAVKIGDKWVSYQKLPPALGIPLAFTAAVHDAYEEKLITDGDLDAVLDAVAKFGNFFADQSYLKNIGDLVASAKGSPEEISRFVSNYPQQVVPYRALMGWMARLIDPYQRKIDTDGNFFEKQVQNLFKEIPGLSQTVPARLDQFDEPIPNQNKEINAVSPFRVTTERPEQKEIYELMELKTKSTRDMNALKKEMEKGNDITAQLAGAEGEQQTDPKEIMKNKILESTAKSKVELQGKFQRVGDKIFVDSDSNGSAETIDLSAVKSLPSSNKYEEAIKNTKAFEVAGKVFNSNLPDSEKNKALKEVGITRDDIEYYSIANDNNNLKTPYVMGEIEKIEDKDKMLEKLAGFRKKVNNTEILSDGVIENLIDDGIITKAEGKALKAIDYDSKGNLKVKASGGGSKSLKVDYRQFIRKDKALKLKAPRLRKTVAVAKKVSQPKRERLKEFKFKDKSTPIKKPAYL